VVAAIFSTTAYLFGSPGKMGKRGARSHGVHNHFFHDKSFAAVLASAFQDDAAFL